MLTYLMASEFNPRGEGTTRVLAAGSVEAVDEEQNGNQSLGSTSPSIVISIQP